MAQLDAAEAIARAWLEAYKIEAPLRGWETRLSCRTEWEDLPSANRAVMIGTARRLLDAGVIRPVNVEEG